jgi:hypothetical protein
MFPNKMKKDLDNIVVALEGGEHDLSHRGLFMTTLAENQLIETKQSSTEQFLKLKH